MVYRSVRTLFAASLALGLSFIADAAPGGGASNWHSALLLPDGSVWAAGQNYNGEVGDDSSQPRAYRVNVLLGASSVAVGSRHTVAVAGGTAYAWGHGTSGELCDDLAVRHSVPTPVPGLTGVVQVAAANFSTFFLLGDGTVRSCGANPSGMLGDGTTTERRVPVTVAGISDAIAISAGPYHALALRANGTVLAWGSNAYGRLGDGTTTDRWTPVPVTGLTAVVAVAAGMDFSLALDASGRVWVWGTGFYGIGGDGTTTDHLTPYQVPGLTNVTRIAAGDSKAVALDANSQVWTWGGGLLGHGVTQGLKIPTVVMGLPPVTAIAAGANSTFAFAADGSIYGWGDNAFGLLGDGTGEIRLSPIVLADAGGVWRTGTPVFTPSGSQTYSVDVTVQITSATPDAVVRYTTTGVDPTEADAMVPAGGLLVDQNRVLKARAWKAGQGASDVAGASFTLQPAVPSISPGTGSYTSPRTVTMATTTAGAVIRYTADGTEPTPSSPAYGGALPIATGSTLKAKAFKSGWTDSGTRTATYTFNYGTIDTPVISPGGGTYSTDQTVSITVPTAPAGAVIRYTTTGSDPNTSSTIYTDPIPVAAGLTLKARVFHPDWTPSAVASAAYAFTVATPTFTQASGTHPAGQVVAIATTTPNATIRYTLNGVNPTANDPVFVPGSTLTLGDYTLKASAWRTGYTTSAVATATYQIEGDLTAAQIAAGDTHTLAVKRDGTIWGFGSNGWGYLGDNSTTARSLPVRAAGVTGIKDVAAGYQHSLAVGLDGRVYSFGTNTSGQQGDGATIGYRTVPWPVPAVTDAIAVAAGQNHSLALTGTGQVYAWGANGSGQLGLGFASPTPSPTPTVIPGLSGIVGIAAGESHSLAWTASGALYAWGNNGNGRLGDNSTTQRTSPVLIAGIAGVAEAAAGRYHTIARTTGGQVFTWGRNGQGQLGLGNTDDRWVPTLVTLPTGVQAIGAGHNHSLASTATTTYAWGQNTSSQVGDGLTANRTLPYATSIGASVQLTGGSVHSVALDTNGAVWTWGGNTLNQLGNGTTTPQTTPSSISGPGQTWGVAAPTADTPAGNYEEEKTVRLTTITPDAIIRYTVNGSDPTISSPIAPYSLSITTTTTLKARAFKTGLDPSGASTFVYSLKVPTPAPSVPANAYTALTRVSLTIPPGASVTYTLSSTAPIESWTPYTAGTTIDIATPTTLRARAARSGWTASDILSAYYDVNIDTTPPTCVARVRPAPLASGWSLGSTTVTFQCRDSGSGLASVTPPIVIDQETSADGVVVSGSGTDRAGNSTATNATVKVDRSAPLVVLNSPVDGGITTDAFATILGTVADELSGVATVRCNHDEVATNDGQVSCVVPLRPGRNPIVLSATDMAGNARSEGVTITRVAPPTSLSIGPSTATLLIGQSRRIVARDESGSIPVGIQWTIDQASVADVSSDGDAAVISATGHGTANVTATWGPLTASAVISVLSPDTLAIPGGTVQWSVTMPTGRQLAGITLLNGSPSSGPRAATLEHADGRSIIRAVSEAGDTLSVTTLDEPPRGEPIADTFGGIIISTSYGLQRLALVPGSMPWRYTSVGSLSQVAQNNDGTVFAIEKTEGTMNYDGDAWVIALDGRTGILKGRFAATRHYWVGLNVHQFGNVVERDSPGFDSDGGLLSASGRYGVVTKRSEAINDFDGTDNRVREAGSWAELFLTMDSAGVVELTALSEGAFTTDWATGVSTGSRSPSFSFRSTGVPDNGGNFHFCYAAECRSIGGPDALTYSATATSTVVALTDNNKFIHQDGSISDAATGLIESPAASSGVQGAPVGVSDSGDPYYWDGEALRLRGSAGEVFPVSQSIGYPIPTGTSSWLLMQTTGSLISFHASPGHVLTWYNVYMSVDPQRQRAVNTLMPVPSGETTFFNGWASPSSPGSKFRGRLNGGTFRWRLVQERSGGGDYDDCHFEGSIFDEWKGVNGSWWPVNEGDEYLDDLLSWPSVQIIYYRNRLQSEGREGCRAETNQIMQINQRGGTWVTYKTNRLKNGFTMTTVWNERDGVAASKTWP